MLKSLCCCDRIKADLLCIMPKGPKKRDFFLPFPSPIKTRQIVRKGVKIWASVVFYF